MAGAPLPNCVEADIFDNAHFAAARFRLKLAIDPATANTLLDPTDVVDIQIGLGGSPVSLLQGQVDSLRIDAINQVVELEGRDLTARLLDARTQETFSNQTASEIATTLAGRHGLTPNVTSTSTLAGRYYQNDRDRLTLGQFSRSMTEWDLLSFLAAREGFDVFVAGTVLTFAPPAAAATPIALTPGDCISLHLDHALTLARDIEVTVKSWNTRQQGSVSQVATTSAKSTGGNGPQRIVVVRPNLSANDAQTLANRILADLSAHERVVAAEIPGELALTPRTQVQLAGTGTDFDQVYRVVELDRHLAVDHGFTERLRLKTFTPDNS